MSLFITFEGGDGSGKSTQIALVAKRLADDGHEVVLGREPGGTPAGREIRRVLLHGDDMSGRTEALLFAADRSHHVDTHILPALARGALVLSDRYYDSSIAYQGAARSLGTDEVAKLNAWATGGLVPDRTFYLDVSAEEGLSRMRGEHDRLESEGLDFQRRVREQYRALIEAEPERFVVIDAEREPDEVAADIYDSIASMLKA